jgi:hypothetical protein
MSHLGYSACRYARVRSCDRSSPAFAVSGQPMTAKLPGNNRVDGYAEPISQIGSGCALRTHSPGDFGNNSA